MRIFGVKTPVLIQTNKDTQRILIRHIALSVICLVIFGACSDVRHLSLIPSAKNDDEVAQKRLERKVQFSRKSQIIKDGQTRFMAIVSYLNEVDNIEQKRDVFLLELYEKFPNPNIQKELTITLRSDTLSEQSLFITQLKDSQYTDVLQSKNTYNKLFVVEFAQISEKHREDMNMEISVEGEGIMHFNFGYPTLRSKLYEIR